MKKVCLLILVMLILLCACKKESPVTPVTKGISFLGEVVFEENLFTFNCVINSSGDMCCTLVSPKDFKGLTFNLNKDKETVEFSEMEYDLDSGDLPYNNLCSIIYKAFENANRLEVENIKGKNPKIVGQVNQNQFELTLSPEGLPLKLELKSIKYVAHFNQLTVI